MGKMKTIDNCVFPKIGVPQNGWFNGKSLSPIQMDDLGGKPTIFGNIQLCVESVRPSIFDVSLSPDSKTERTPETQPYRNPNTSCEDIWTPKPTDTPSQLVFGCLGLVRTTFWLVQNPINTRSNGGLLVVLDTGNPEQPWTEALGLPPQKKMVLGSGLHRT